MGNQTGELQQPCASKTVARFVSPYLSPSGLNPCQNSQFIHSNLFVEKKHVHSFTKNLSVIVYLAGDLVVATWGKDKAWYRGRVQQVNESGPTALVLFVDYGNTAWLPFRR